MFLIIFSFSLLVLGYIYTTTLSTSKWKHFCVFEKICLKTTVIKIIPVHTDL